MSSYIALFEDEIRKLSHRPRLLFHACCGVCCVYPLLLLDDYFDVTIYYTNDNIYPEEEYDLRLRELTHQASEVLVVLAQLEHRRPSSFVGQGVNTPMVLDVDAKVKHYGP